MLSGAKHLAVPPGASVMLSGAPVMLSGAKHRPC
jgi:hypothetical protein